MNYLSIEGLSKSFGDRNLFEGLSFGLNKGDKVALIANNGTGKSSLLKIIAGIVDQDEGKVILRDGISLRYLAQEPIFDEKLNINDLIKSSHSEVLQIIRSYETALQNQSDNYTTQSHKEFELATANMDSSEAWDYEQRLKQILNLFNITDLDQQIGKLSGGQKKRLALALVLLDKPDILLLDEPTNHLDIEMIEWLEKQLKLSASTLLMVTHDRYFLDNVCNKIIELENNQLYHFKGNYAYFLEKKAEREELQQTEVHKAKQLYKQELEWMRRSPQARTTKSKARIDAFYKTRDKATVRTLKTDLKIEIKSNRVGGKILELKDVSKSYNNQTIINNFSYIFKKGERAGVFGKNGIGKSTFLNIISQQIKVDSGQVESGETIIYGYFKQEGIKLDEHKKVIDVVKDIAEVIELKNGSRLTASQFLNHFLFPPEMQYNLVSKLSGGERRRLYLLTVLVKNPNFLILDEPTNDLDLPTLNKLEEFLMNYAGCLLLVSHDRYFMDRLVDHFFIFKEEGEIKDFYGSYSEYRAEEDTKLQLQKEQKAAEKLLKKKGLDEQKVSKPKTKLSYKEKLRYQELEQEIDKLEKEKANLEIEINQEGLGFEELNKKSERIASLIEEIDDKTLEWMELDEFV